ncbi:MAG: hypothetical protein PHQ65_09890 [Bacteroidales bacterium]|nr:hypothetical protein [Bacteroidales bacterium]MDD3665562.1 hypothetical protein [Bacteroidales bacterium]
MRRLLSITAAMLLPWVAAASEADLKVPDLRQSYFDSVGMNGHSLLLWGIIIIVLGLAFGIWQFLLIKNYPLTDRCSM